ncbi:MAG: sensor histidine kinase [Candidatus Riflemargulisbacteria bacterium]
MHYTICDYISDITQNSIEAGATLVTVDYRDKDEKIEITITDNGKGMDELTLKKAIDPSYTDTVKKHKREIGLGLPFIIQGIEQSQGEFFIDSQKDKGTMVKFSFDKQNIDTPPVGDKSLTYLTLFNYPGNFNIAIQEHNNQQETISFNKKELYDVLGDLNSSETLTLLKQYLKDNIL